MAEYDVDILPRRLRRLLPKDDRINPSSNMGRAHFGRVTIACMFATDLDRPHCDRSRFTIFAIAVPANGLGLVYRGTAVL